MTLAGYALVTGAAHPVVWENTSPAASPFAQWKACTMGYSTRHCL